MLRRLSLVILVALLALGCKRGKTAEEEAKKVTPTSTDDATKELVDENYRFRLTWPGTGWKILREKDARHLNPDAVAGLSNGTGVNGIVIVEHLPGTELAAFTDIIIEGMALEDKQVVERKAVKVGSIDAMRFRVTGKMNDLPIEFRALLLIHQEHAYQMLAFVPAKMGKEDLLDTVLSSFSIMPGDVKGREVSTVVDDQTGVGWRVAKGVFEGAASRLRVRPAEGWRLLVGDELHKMNPDADVGLSGGAVGAYVTVISEPIPGGDPETYIKGRIDAVMAGLTPVDKPFTTTVIGKEVTFARGKRDAGMPLEYAIAAFIDGGRGYQFLTWYPVAKGKTAEPAVLAALRSFELMSAADLAKVTNELAAMPDRQNYVGATYALRAGTYLDFENQLRWRLPPGFWKFLVGQEARAANADTLVGAQDVVRGLQMQLVVEKANGLPLDSYASAVESQLTAAGIKIDRRAEATLGAAKARVLEGTLVTAGLSLRYRSIAGVIGPLAIQLSLWGARAEWPDDAAVDAIAKGIERAPSLVEVETGAAFKHHRLGFSVALPGSWRHDDETPAAMRPIAALHQWKSGRNSIMVIAVFSLEQQADDWMIDLVEQTMRQKIASVAAIAPTKDRATLAGRDARHVMWSSGNGRADLLMLKRDATFYAVLAISDDMTTATLESAKSSFQLLD